MINTGSRLKRLRWSNSFADGEAKKAVNAIFWLAMDSERIDVLIEDENMRKGKEFGVDLLMENA